MYFFFKNAKHASGVGRAASCLPPIMAIHFCRSSRKNTVPSGCTVLLPFTIEPTLVLPTLVTTSLAGVTPRWRAILRATFFAFGCFGASSATTCTGDFALKLGPVKGPTHGKKPTAEDLKASAKQIQYHIYDLPSHPGTFVQRYNSLVEMNLPECCVRVRTDICGDESIINDWYEDYVDWGYEGQMIRLDKEYESKRSKSLLKYKSFIDEEYTILDIVEGLGNKTGMVGSFIFENKDGKRFSASPKFNWSECTEMWKRKDELIGKSATVKYFNLTPDSIPRFPYVIKIDRESYE